MRKVIVLLMVVLLPLALVGMLGAMQANRSKWQFAVDQYVEHRGFSGTTTVRSVDQARKPWNFDAKMSRIMFSGGVHCQTEDSYSEGSAKPLLFPPQDVWCVLLDHERDPVDGTGEQVTYEVVFVAEHVDLHTAEVVVHAAAQDPSDPELGESLSAIGCDVGLGRLSLE